MSLNDELLPLLKRIAEDRADMSARDVLGDWLDEHGMFRGEAYGWFFPRPFDVYSSGSGSGSGSGIGIGSGSGSGSGIGIGSGSGIGRGRGSGSGIGRGSGVTLGSEVCMIVGKAYLLHQGDWHTFVGRCVAQVGPFTYLFHYASQIMNTNNGPNWNDLQRGDKKARKEAEYRHESTPQEFPLTIRAGLWLGKTPAEEAGIEMIEE